LPIAAPERRWRAAASRVRGRLGFEHPALVAILALSTVLNVRVLSRNGYGNTYYSAAVKSMLGSLHRFGLVSFDPGSLIMVDKPPLGLWLQTASAKLFGFTPLSLLLPEAIVGVLAVLALYLLVARRFGPLAGLASALALAVFPSFVAVSRDNNLDTLLIFLMIVACGAGLRAIETGRVRHLLLAALIVGLAFNTKALAAYLVVPGLAVAYLACAPGTLPRRLLALVAAGAVLAVVSLAWLSYVQLTPASQRPFVGGSTNNSEFQLALGYNGFGRVGGQVGGPGRVPNVLPPAPRPARPLPRVAPQRGRHRAVHPTAFGGPTGPLRLFSSGLGDQGGWILPFALLGAIATALTLRERRDPRAAALIVLGAWFVAEAAVLSLSKGIVHPYYVSALGPGAAAMCGIGVVSLARLLRQSRWWLALAVAAIGTTITAQTVMLHREDYLRWDIPLVAAAGGLAVIAMLARRNLARPALALALAALLVAPAAYAKTTWDAPVEGTFPAAGPYQAAGNGGIGLAPGSVRVNRALLAFVRARQPGTRFELLTLASSTAAPLILMGAKAAAIAGYSGTDPALSARGLAGMVRRGEARWVLLGGAYSSRGGTAASRATAVACRHVPAVRWRPRVVSATGLVIVPLQSRTTLELYDCRARADALLGGRRPSQRRAAPRRHTGPRRSGRGRGARRPTGRVLLAARSRHP
jgi:4-amino-4-deoxy-L-arabinose transferase-like glycosyltransferase